LRLSDIGYSNRVVGGLRISYNSLDEYVDGLNRAITTSHPAYARIGTHRDGDWLQLNANVLQIENEYYSFVRPKRVPSGNEKRTAALARDGIEYVELRSMDLDPWAPEGLTIETLRFLELFALWALLSDSPLMTEASQYEQDENLQTVARCGRRPDLGLTRAGQAISLTDWASELLDNLAAVATILDRDHEGDSYSAGVAQQRIKVADPEKTPSAKVLAEMRDSGEAFFHFAQRRSESTRVWYGAREIAPERLSQLTTQAEQSRAQQASIEASDDMSFDTYLENYFAQD
jgi:glutamate--cysteine ligase